MLCSATHQLQLDVLAEEYVQVICPQLNVLSVIQHIVQCQPHYPDPKHGPHLNVLHQKHGSMLILHAHDIQLPVQYSLTTSMATSST